MTVEIYKSDFLEWWLDDNDSVKNMIFEALYDGCKPVHETVKNSVEFFNMCGYLPFRFVKNIKKIKPQLTENEIEEEEINDCREFKVKWV